MMYSMLIWNIKIVSRMNYFYCLFHKSTIFSFLLIIVNYKIKDFEIKLWRRKKRVRNTRNIKVIKSHDLRAFVQMTAASWNHQKRLTSRRIMRANNYGKVIKIVNSRNNCPDVGYVLIKSSTQDYLISEKIHNNNFQC